MKPLHGVSKRGNNSVRHNSGIGFVSLLLGLVVFWQSPVLSAKEFINGRDAQVSELQTTAANLIAVQLTLSLGVGFSHLSEQQTAAQILFLDHLPFWGRLFGKPDRSSDHYQRYVLANLDIINYAELEAKL